MEKERVVVIHVTGGVAEVVECPNDVHVEIVDFDNLYAGEDYHN